MEQVLLKDNSEQKTISAVWLDMSFDLYALFIFSRKFTYFYSKFVWSCVLLKEYHSNKRIIKSTVLFAKFEVVPKAVVTTVLQINVSSSYYIYYVALGDFILVYIDVEFFSMHNHEWGIVSNY